MGAPTESDFTDSSGGGVSAAQVNSAVAAERAEREAAIAATNAQVASNSAVLLHKTDAGVFPSDLGNFGDWDAGHTYLANQVVHYNGDPWLAVNPSVGVAPAEPAWENLGQSRSMSLGPGTFAGAGASAVGIAPYAPGLESTAVGHGPVALGDRSLALGHNVTATEDDEVNLNDSFIANKATGTSRLPGGMVDLDETVDATNPAAGRRRIIARVTGLFLRNSAGTEVKLASTTDITTAVDALPDLAAGNGIDLLTAAGTTTVSTQGPDVQDFSTVGANTYTVPTGAKGFMVYALAGGGGGGAGRKGAEGTLRVGGCGGTAGAAVIGFIPASAVVGSTVTVTVGAGGNGAPSRTTNSTNGAAGSNGGDSSFGSLLVAKGGYGGTGGGAAGMNRAYGDEPPSMWPVGISGLNGDNGSGIAPHIGGAGHAGGGSAGGYRTVANANSLVSAGGAGTGGAGGAGVTGGNAGTAGSTLYGGGGGSGSQATATGTPLTGGAGAAPAGGGGGGGAGVDTVGNSGAGGNGAKGFVRVVALR